MKDEVSRLVRPNILSLEPYHSAREEVREGVLLDANESPHGREWEGVLLNRYPDPGQTQLRRSLAQYLGVVPDQVVAGVGSDELLDWIFKVFCQPGEDAVAVAEPTYGMYRVLADVYGVDCSSFGLGPGFEFSVDRFTGWVTEKVKVAFLCSPNNPTGNLLDRGEILRLCRVWGKIVVLDEAYVEFSGQPSLVGELNEYPNLILLRTLSKAFGKAGLRLGYAVASSAIVQQFMKVKAPYNLSGITMEAGCRAIRNARQELAWLGQVRSELRRVFEELGRIPRVVEVFPSQANFLLFRCSPGPAICRALREQEIVVRDRGTLPGLEDCIRVSIGTPPENDLFLKTLRGILEKGI